MHHSAYFANRYDSLKRILTVFLLAVIAFGILPVQAGASEAESTTVALQTQNTPAAGESARLLNKNPLLTQLAVYNYIDRDLSDSEIFLFGVFYGILFAMLVKNAVLFLSTLEKHYLYYSLLTACSMLLFGFLDGVGFPNFDSWHCIPVFLLIYLAIFFNIWFGRAYLDTADVMPRIDKWLQQIGFLTLVGAVGLFFIPYVRFNVTAVLVLMVVSVPLLFRASYARYAAGHQLSLYYGVGWLVLLFFTLLVELAERQLFQTGIGAMYLHKIGAGLFLTLLSMAMAVRIKTLNQSEQQLDKAKLDTRLLTKINDYNRAQVVQSKAKLNEAERAARTDSLTGIGNRKGFDEDLARALEIYRLDHDKDTLLGIIDLDGMKSINDNRGHEAGDEMLRIFAGYLDASGRASDQSYRFGGDEFGLLLASSDIEIIRERLREVIKQVQQEGFEEVDLSVGFATFAECDGDLKQTIKLADTRMYEDKRAKKKPPRGS